MNRQEAEQVLLQKAGKFTKLFNSPEGQEVLKLLEDEFEPVNLFDVNPHVTSYNAGRRDAIQYIKQMMRVHDANTQTTI